MQPSLMCAACGTEFPADQPVPQRCPICVDPRQYIPQSGQRWTSFKELAATHTVKIESFSTTLHSLQVSPGFAIDQRALLFCSPDGNIPWDCIPLIDGPTIDFIRSRQRRPAGSHRFARRSAVCRRHETL